MYRINNTVCITSEAINEFKSSIPMREGLLRRKFPTIEFMPVADIAGWLFIQCMQEGKFDVRTRYVAAHILPKDSQMMVDMYGPLTTVVFHLDNFVTWPNTTSWKSLTRALDGLNAGAFECSICYRGVNNLVHCQTCQQPMCPECKFKTEHCPFCRTDYEDDPSEPYLKAVVSAGLHLSKETPGDAPKN